MEKGEGKSEMEFGGVRVTVNTNSNTKFKLQEGESDSEFALPYCYLKPSNNPELDKLFTRPDCEANHKHYVRLTVFEKVSESGVLPKRRGVSWSELSTIWATPDESGTKDSIKTNLHSAVYAVEKPSMYISAHLTPALLQAKWEAAMKHFKFSSKFSSTKLVLLNFLDNLTNSKYTVTSPIQLALQTVTQTTNPVTVTPVDVRTSAVPFNFNQDPGQIAAAYPGAEKQGFATAQRNFAYFGYDGVSYAKTEQLLISKVFGGPSREEWFSKSAYKDSLLWPRVGVVNKKVLGFAEKQLKVDFGQTEKTDNLTPLFREFIELVLKLVLGGEYAMNGKKNLKVQLKDQRQRPFKTFYQWASPGPEINPNKYIADWLLEIYESLIREMDCSDPRISKTLGDFKRLVTKPIGLTYNIVTDVVNLILPIVRSGGPGESDNNDDELKGSRKRPMNLIPGRDEEFPFGLDVTKTSWGGQLPDAISNDIEKLLEIMGEAEILIQKIVSDNPGSTIAKSKKHLAVRKLFFSTYRLWLPNMHVHDFEGDDIAAFLLLTYLRSLAGLPPPLVLAQLPYTDEKSMKQALERSNLNSFRPALDKLGWQVVWDGGVQVSSRRVTWPNLTGFEGNYAGRFEAEKTNKLLPGTEWEKGIEKEREYAVDLEGVKEVWAERTGLGSNALGKSNDALL